MAVMIGNTVVEWCAMWRVQGIVLFLVLTGAGFAFANPPNCELVRKDIEAKGFPSVEVLSRPSTGSICGDGSCCSQDLENYMLRYSHAYVDKYLKDSISKIVSLIDTRARKFDDFFRDMMNNSKREFHEMFERTYGKIYLQNSQVFADFFGELETYYQRGTVRLSDTMETFFGVLYQRMFTVINAQYTFDDRYLECVAEHMVEMRPFGDVPHKLGVQLRRSFVATRTFYKALVQGADAASAVQAVRLDTDCDSALARMQFCGVCRGEGGAGACSSYCTDVLERCLRRQAALSDAWDLYVDAIEKVADRLLGPYNIEVVVEPLNIKISEAIMNFQESGTEVSQKIYAKCGKPPFSRTKRKAEYKSQPEDNPNMEIKYEPMKSQLKKTKPKKVQEKVDSTPTLEKIIADIKMKVKDTKQFWLQLPYQYCNNGSISAAPSENGQCWNGTSIGSYDKTQRAIPDPSEAPIVSEQIYVLQSLTDKLRKAYQGQEVEIVDDTEETIAGSGSGSGDGDFDEEDEEQPRINLSPNKDNDIFVDQGQSVPSLSSTEPPSVHTSKGNKSTMSLTQALVRIILPIVMVWFGGAIKDLL